MYNFINNDLCKFTYKNDINKSNLQKLCDKSMNLLYLTMNMGKYYDVNYKLSFYYGKILDKHKDNYDTIISGLNVVINNLTICYKHNINIYKHGDTIRFIITS